MQSFRTELENIGNPVVEKDILDLERKIRLFREGKIDEEKFRSLRLARGVYGQRQPGVQMVRIKLPFGKVTTKQLRRIADISDEYASGVLHATTRQDIQIHHVSLDKTPELWAKLEQDDITLREACGNTVRNITASAAAGVDPDEVFDVSPYAQALFQYFLRNPVCQEMGRKFKIAFASSDSDTAYTFIHDIGFIPRTINNERGFKVVIGGGLGANPNLAVVAYEFLPADQIVPLTECLLRVFDRYGERTRRMKARFKFLLEELGLDKVMELVEQERTAIPNKSYPIDTNTVPFPAIPDAVTVQPELNNPDKYDRWFRTNVFEQKQKGLYGVYVKVPLGNMSSRLARAFADVVDQFASEDVRITINQGYLLRFVPLANIKSVFVALDALGLAEPGFDSVGDITACPGTDTCNLGISSSYGVALAMEEVIRSEYPELIYNNDIKIKISGCPNSCGQHGLASIGFHGSSVKDKSGNVLPSLVVLLGGAKVGGGEGIVAEKVIKIPSKRGIAALRLLLDDYETNSQEGEYYHTYYQRIGGRKYFYDLLKPLGDVSQVAPDEYIDWGEEHKFILHTAVGECAGVIIDLVATLLYESEEKLQWATESLEGNAYADSIYHSYSAFINTAKALLLTVDVRPSTQIQTLNDFQKHFVDTGEFTDVLNFPEHVLRINKVEPGARFAEEYQTDSKRFLDLIQSYRLSKVETQATAKVIQ
jgi:sulfite reductase (ferredoxin)